MGKTVSDSDPVPAAAADNSAATERRLHPLSWLFVLGTQMRSMALPLVALLLFGKGDWWVFAGLLGAVVVALYALIYSFSFRYRIGERELLVRAGIFSRTERHVPYERIQNIVQKRNLLHQLFDVTELRLESAGGSEPEAVMNVITLKAAAELEAVLKRRGADATLAVAEGGDEIAPWHVLSAGDLLRLGLLNNRGWVIVGALSALVWQFSEDNSWNPMKAYYRFAGEVFGAWTHAFAGYTARALSVLAIAVIVLLLVKLLSIVMAFLTFHRFRLAGDDVRLSTAAGLLTRHVASARRDKIQRLIIGEGWLARRLGRRWLSCEVAAGAQVEADAENEALRLRWLAPVGTADQIDTIIARVMPGLDFARLEWKPLHPRAWRRMFNAALFWWSIFLVPAVLFVSHWMLVPAAAIVGWSWLHARGWARFAAYACDGDYVAFRAGWLHRQWTVAAIGKGQTVSISHSPFDRRRGMHTVGMDTAGARLSSFSLSVPYLPTDEAAALAETLRQRISGEDQKGNVRGGS
jgi:putative membrane protein